MAIISETIYKKTLGPLHPISLIPGDFDFTSKIDDVLGQPEQDRTTFKIYDTAIAGWVRKRVSMNGHTLPVVPSSPQNAFASYKKLLPILGIELCKDDERNYDGMPMPMLSINQTGYENRPGDIGGYPIRNIAFFDSRRAPGPLNRGTAFTRYPKPLWLNYSISIWALKREHLAWIVQRMEMAFRNKLAHFRVCHHPFTQLPQIKYVTAIQHDGYEDASETERGERDERILRGVFRVKVEAWMWDDLMHAPTVLKEGREWVEGRTGEELFNQLIPLTPDAPARSTPTEEPGVEI